MIVVVEADYLELDYIGSAVSQTYFLPEICVATVEELNKLQANEMINGLGWQNDFPFPCRTTDEDMANVICRLIFAVIK